jgi:hypothetical protein
MKLKNIYLLIFPALVFMSSCIYEDGPKMSFRSKKARAVNSWIIDKAYEAGVDKTDAYKTAFVNYELDLKNDDNYRLSYRAYNLIDYVETGTWDLSADKLYIVFKPANTTQENKSKILRLKNNEAWVIVNVNNKDVELHLKD